MKTGIKEKVSAVRDAVSVRFLKKKGIVQEGPPERKSARKSKKRKRRIIVTVLCLAAVLVVAYFLFVRNGSMGAFSRSNGGMSLAYDDTTVLAYKDFFNSISATGRVESNNSHMVYSNLSYPVQEVYVSVGDYITPDTLLCKLDSSSLEDQIESKELSMGISAESAAQQVKAARDSYHAAKDAVDNGENSSMINAKSSVQTAYENWVKANKTYVEYRDSLDGGLNTTLLSQDSAVESAKKALESAQSLYNAAKTDYDTAKTAMDSYTPVTSGNDGEVAAAQTIYAGAVLDQQIKQTGYDTTLAGYQAAQDAYNLIASPTDVDIQALASSKKAYDDALVALNAAKQAASAALEMLTAAKERQAAGVDATYQALSADCGQKKTAFDNANAALGSAKTSYDNAVRNRQSAYQSTDSTLASYASSVDAAYRSYLTALASYDATVASVETSLQSSKNSLASAEINANNNASVLELAQLQEDLEATQIYAGVEGTVTAIYATVGSSGSGLLFVIEDIHDLIVETSVKEYDVGSVSAGMPVTIRSDATGSDSYDGTVISVAPTSNKTSQGTTDTSGDVLFATKVKVTSQNTRLRIGMSVRLNYIIEQQANVLTVPYDAVYTNEVGETCVLILEAQASGNYLIKELKVTKLLENDLELAIGGDGVKEGLRIVNEPDSYRSLLGKEIPLVERVQQNTMPFSMG